MSTFLGFMLVFWVAAALYSTYRWTRLVKKYEQLADELFEAESNLNKLKLLNRLKVDWEGKSIRYEGCSNEDITYYKGVCEIYMKDRYQSQEYH